MRRIVTTIATIILSISVAVSGHIPYRYHDYTPVIHGSGFFDKENMMHSFLYGSFGIKYDYVKSGSITLNTYGAYLEYCNILASFTYGQNESYKAYDASASFLIPMHPNLRIGPRIDYTAVGGRQGGVTNGYDKSSCAIGVTIDIHLKSVSLIADISPRSMGFGFGWAFGCL